MYKESEICTQVGANLGILNVHLQEFLTFVQSSDPQVLSIDFRFGDGDLGPRGMALFFKSFKHCDLSGE